MTAITETNEMAPCHLCICNSVENQAPVEFTNGRLILNGKLGFEQKFGNMDDRPSNECQTTCSIIRQYVHTRVYYIPQHNHSMILACISNVMTMNFV